MRRRLRLRRFRSGLVTLAVLAGGGCVGSGKVARADEIGALPPGVEIAVDVSMGCREGESGFDYRFVVLTGTSDLSTDGPLPRALRANDFYHSEGLIDDLPWITVGYQQRQYPLRAELGLLRNYLARPVSHQGPDPASLPAALRTDAGDAVLVALRPTDFACTTPL